MEINKNKYRVYDTKHFMMLHWVLNPGLAVNELVFGQRVPKVMLEDKTSNKPRYERTFVPCPHCNTLHDGRTWSMQNNTAYKNWFGLYCPACSNIIPCLTNFTSIIILALTFPLWGWFRKSLKERWLAKQPARFRNINPDQKPDPFAKKGWLKPGIMFGLFMYIGMVILFPLAGGEEITLFKLLIGIPVWLAAGLLWGYFMKVFFTKKGNANNGFIARKP